MAINAAKKRDKVSPHKFERTSQWKKQWGQEPLDHSPKISKFTLFIEWLGSVLPVVIMGLGAMSVGAATGAGIFSSLGPLGMIGGGLGGALIGFIGGTLISFLLVRVFSPSEKSPKQKSVDQFEEDYSDLDEEDYSDLDEEDYSDLDEEDYSDLDEEDNLDINKVIQPSQRTFNLNTPPIKNTPIMPEEDNKNLIMDGEGTLYDDVKLNSSESSSTEYMLSSLKNKGKKNPLLPLASTKTGKPIEIVIPSPGSVVPNGSKVSIGSGSSSPKTNSSPRDPDTDEEEDKQRNLN